MSDGRVIAGLDIGNDSTRVLVAELNSDGVLDISGWAHRSSKGLRKGVVVNIEAASEIIQDVVETAEQEAGRTVTELWASIGGESVSSFNSRGVVPISGKNREICHSDVERVLETARTVNIPLDRDILHILAQEYVVDNQNEISDPIGMIGVRLESEVHIVTASLAAIENMKKAVERVHFKLCGYMMGCLASSEAVLNQDERDIGVLQVNIGAVSTDFVLLRKGTLHMTGTIPVGGQLASSDLSYVLKTSPEIAEKLKRESGVCWVDNISHDDTLLIPMVGGHSPQNVEMIQLANILQSRMEELFRLIKKQVDKIPGSRQLPGGVVLTGGGALLKGIESVAANVFDLPVRVGMPRESMNLPNDCRSPEWATVVGLVKKGCASLIEGRKEENLDVYDLRKTLKGAVNWLGKFF